MGFKGRVCGSSGAMRSRPQPAGKIVRETPQRSHERYDGPASEARPACSTGDAKDIMDVFENAV